MGPQEQRLVDRGFKITERDLDEQPDHEVIGVLAVRPLNDGTQWWLHVRTGTTPELREVYAEWALPRIERYLSKADYDDHWQPTADPSVQQSWARLRYLPEV